jgi:dTMP kinase
MIAKKNSGIFITLEGIEGTGKSTVIYFLAHYLQSLHRAFISTREPGGTEIAEDIRKLVLKHHDESMSPDTELLLMFASRAQHIATVIRPALEMGKIVLSDRFTDATYAYQGGGRGIDNNRIKALEQWVQKGLQPNLTILLDAPIEVSSQRILSRGAKDRIEQEKIDFFHRVRNCYLERANAFPDRFRIIDATESIDKVKNNLYRITSTFLEKGTIDCSCHG